MTLQEFQRGLIRLGFDLGKGGADGVPGRMTAAATIAFKKLSNLSATPAIGPQTIAAMRQALSLLPGLPASKPAAGATAAAPDPVWLIEARRNLAVHEVRDRKTVLGWAARLGSRVLGINYTDTGTPWCGLFVAHCIGLTLPQEPMPSIVVRASSWDKFGKSSGLGLGAVVRLERPGGGHVFFATGVTADGKFVRGIGGNQSNRVSEAMFEASRIKAVRFPLTGGQVRALPIVNAAGVVVSRNEA